jgi:hypothetical protein
MGEVYRARDTRLDRDVVALTAIAQRISEFGFTPNRVAAFGENVILLVNLTWTAWLYASFLRRRRSFAALEQWQIAYPPCICDMGGAGGCRVPALVRLPLMPRRALHRGIVLTKSRMVRPARPWIECHCGVARYLLSRTVAGSRLKACQLLDICGVY